MGSQQPAALLPPATLLGTVGGDSACPRGHTRGTLLCLTQAPFSRAPATAPKVKLPTRLPASVTFSVRPPLLVYFPRHFLALAHRVRAQQSSVLRGSRPTASCALPPSAAASRMFSSDHRAVVRPSNSLFTPAARTLLGALGTGLRPTCCRVGAPGPRVPQAAASSVEAAQEPGWAESSCSPQAAGPENAPRSPGL